MYLHVHIRICIFISLFILYLYFFGALVVNIYQHIIVQNKEKKTWWMVIIVIRELHEAVESLGDEDSVMGFMKAMRTSGGYRQKNSREPFFGRPLALLVPLVLGGRRDQSQGAAACLRLSVCCIFWNPG